MTKRTLASLLILSGSLLVATNPVGADDEGSILQRLKTVRTLASTVPSNGDVNPYGIFEVPRGIGDLQQGHFLVSNFNAASNLQGTGRTIVDTCCTRTSRTAALLPGGGCPQKQGDRRDCSLAVSSPQRRVSRNANLLPR